MVPKSVLKFIKSLKLKKYREAERRFMIEGAKSVLEVVGSNFEVETIVGTTQFLENFSDQFKIPHCEIFEASQKQIEAMGSFRTNNSVVAVARTKRNVPIQIVPGEYALALDHINDPGNLGTIIRTADWFGITKIICSDNTADLYNPKVINATMGSFTRVSVFYTDLVNYLSSANIPIYGTFVKGESVHQATFDKQGLILLGSESHGLGPELERYIDRRISISGFGKAESLNVAVAAGIICDNLRRQIH